MQYLIILAVLLVGCSTTPNIQNSSTEEKYITLNSENNFIDYLEEGYFTRGGQSGPGTGPFISPDYEFTKGNCFQPNMSQQTWNDESPGCGSDLIEAEWCSRLKSNHKINYTLRFLSWTRGYDECFGDCISSENKTAYTRIRTK